MLIEGLLFTMGWALGGFIVFKLENSKRFIKNKEIIVKELVMNDYKAKHGIKG